MDPAQKKMAETMAAGRGPGGSFNIVVRSPGSGSLFYDMGERIRFHMSVPDKLKELAILLTARYWTAHFEWQAHRRAAAQAGLSEEKIKAIAEGRRPAGMSADEEMIYEFSSELHQNQGVSDATYTRVLGRFGEQGVIDLIGVNGYYTFLAMVLNTTRTALPKGATPPLAPFPR